MITEEEREEIINAAVGRAMLLVPEVVGNMMSQQATLHKMNRDFYSQYPEFKDHKKSVASVIEQIEGKNPLDSYDKLLEKAVPEIRKRINTLGLLDTENITTNHNRQYESFEPLDSPKINPNGVI